MNLFSISDCQRYFQERIQSDWFLQLGTNVSLMLKHFNFHKHGVAFIHVDLHQLRQSASCHRLNVDGVVWGQAESK